VPSDEEIICAWMEPRPTKSPLRRDELSRHWWQWNRFDAAWGPRYLTLDALWEVEERLTDEQRLDYRESLVAPHRDSGERGLPLVMLYWVLLHATPEQKIRALAQVLRSGVENPNAFTQQKRCGSCSRKIKNRAGWERQKRKRVALASVLRPLVEVANA
jgi:hypothetical protein